MTQKLYACGSGLTINSVTLSAASVGLGQNFSVTVVYQQTGGWNQVYLLGAFNSNQATFQPCNTVGQDFAIYSGAPGNGDSPNANNDAPPGGDLVHPGGTGAATQIYTVTAPATLTPGTTYNFIVGGSGCDAKCGDPSNMESQAAGSILINLPPPNFTINKRVEAATSAPNGLVLFDLDYYFVNSGPSNITDPIPANITFVQASPGGTVAGGSVSWNFGNVTNPIRNTAWFLGRINSGTPDLTAITNQASVNALPAPQNSNSVTTIVHIPQLTLTKSQSAASLAAGATVTYNLDWTAPGQNLQIFDSYDNITAGTNTTGATVPWGYDGTNYTVAPGPGPGNSLGTWTVRTDPQGNNFVVADVPYNGAGSGGNYPEMVRSVPGANICDTIIVEGDLQIPATAAGAGTGADAHMVIACNPSQGITLKAAISIDNFPGNLFVQKNNIYPLQSPSASMNFTSPFSVAPGQWYTMMSTVHSTGTGTTTFSIALWPRGNPAQAVTLNYTDTFAPQPTCSGGWRAGWQADETAGTNWFTNLKVFGPGPIVNAAVTDAVPAGVTYIGASPSPAQLSPLVWNVGSGAFPATMFSFDQPINWWGTVACPGPIANQFTMAADSIPPVTSNTVNLNVTCPPTPTPVPCKVLVYLNVGGCDGTGGATGGAVTNLITTLQNAGAQVTTIGVCTNNYCPTGDNWGQYAQVWDARFYGSAQLCSSPVTYNDLFDVCWQTYAQTYLQNGGNLYLQGENAGYPSRYFGNDSFFHSVGAVTGSYVDCPLGTNSNDYSDLGVAIPSTLPGTSQFFGFAVGGIPVADSNGTNFVTYTGPWNNSASTNRAIATGWTAAQMTLGAGAGKLFACWDTTMWTAGYYTGANKTITDTFFSSVFQWMGGTSCGPSPTPTNSPTSTPTNTPSPTATNSPTPTPTNSPTNSPTFTVTNSPTNTPTATVTATPTNTTTPTITPTPTATPAGLHLWPNPFDPKYAVGHVVKVYQVPPGSTLSIYTVSGELVIDALTPDATGLITWDGRNKNGIMVSSGVYYYLLRNNGSTLLTGKLLVLVD